MRITNQLFFSNVNYNYQNNMNELYKTNQQLASGLKITNSYDDSGVYVDAMRLEYEVSTLEQVKESSSKAQTFANNTDKAMNQFSDSLDQFKTKLLQAASGTHSTTSLEALASELEGELEHLKSVANTSINGTYIFSGSATSVKPINNDGTYNGNGESIKALVGSGVQLAYNIDGESLFIGKDIDYSRIVSTNVSLYNQTKLYPNVMDPATNNGTSKEVFITESSTIRDLVGDIDDITTNDPDSVFYIRGKDSSGTTINTKIQLTSDAKVEDLLEQIGIAYGNTSSNSLVEVSLNNSGQIEIKDLQSGSSELEFHMFGAVDRNETNGSGNAGNADVSDIDDLTSNPNIDIVEFIKSDFKSVPTSAEAFSRENTYAAGSFSLGFPLENDGAPVTATTLLQDFMGTNLDNIDFAGVNDAGVPVATTFSVGAGSTVQDLLTAIEGAFGNVSARVENGQILVTDDSISSNSAYGTSNLQIQLTSQDSSNADINSFTIADSMNFERRGFELDGNELLGNISQIINTTGSYAVAKDKLVDAAGVSTLVGTTLTLDITDVSGNEKSARINLASPQSTFDIDLDGNGSFGANENFVIFNAAGGDTSADDMTYQQLMDVVGMMIANVLPTDLDAPVDGIQFDEYNTANTNSKIVVDVELDHRGRLQITDRKNSVSAMRLSMYDATTDDITSPASLSFMANNAITIDDPSIDFFADMQQMIDAVRSGEYRANGNSDDPRNPGIQGALKRIDHIADHFTKQHTKIGALSNALQSSNERAELLSLNVQTVKSEIIDADIAETTLKFQQILIQYQAMLSSISRINSLSLVNYM